MKLVRPPAIVAFLALGACEHTPTALSQHEIDTGYATRIETSSLYVAMDDGVRIAIDVHLPGGIPGVENFPAILELTRYWRDRGDGLSYLARRALERGFAYVIMDERGTGASFGEWPYPLQDRALEDGKAVIDWIIAQPWSNGNVGATGVSYPGMAAQRLAALGHPALKAVVPMSDTWDQYDNLLFPGGVFNEGFIKGWSDIVYLMDRVPQLRFDDEVFRLSPVDADQYGTLLSAAQAEHAGNLYAYEAIRDNLFRDEPVVAGVTLDDISTHSRIAALNRSATRLYNWGSWLDAGSADGVIRQFMESEGPQRAVIGAWSHDLESNTSPFMQAGSMAIPRIQAQWEEALNFFDELLKKERPLQGRILRYMTLNTGEWKSTSSWPVPGTETVRLYLAEGGSLSWTAPGSQEGEDSYIVDFDAMSSEDPRWLSPLFGNTQYPNRQFEDAGLLVYETSPLTEDLEVTGYPVVHLNVSSTHTDGAFIVYLEDVDRYQRATYVTEGILRAIHRKVSADPGRWIKPVPYHSYRSEDAALLVPGQVAELSFGMQPTSVVFGAGNRVRIAIAGHDASAFRRIPTTGTPTITVQRNAVYPSYVELPVIRK